MLGFLAAAVAWPLFLFASGVYDGATGWNGRGTATFSIQFERHGDVYTGVHPGGIRARPGGEPVGVATIVTRHLRHTGTGNGSMHTLDEYSCTWTPSRPSDEVIDGIVKSWAKSIPDYDNVRNDVEVNLPPFTLNEVLKADSRRIESRDWPFIFREASLDAAPVCAALAFLGTPILVGLYLTLRQQTFPSGVCPNCGYSTKGLTGPLCPECGTNLSHPPN